MSAMKDILKVPKMELNRHLEAEKQAKRARQRSIRTRPDEAIAQQTLAALNKAAKEKKA